MGKKDQIQELLKDVWPQERDIFVRPHRLKYVRKIIKPKGCVFCEAGKVKDLQSRHVLYRSDNAMVLLNKYPYNNGHLLIMPVRHCGDLEKLKTDESSEVHWLITKTVEILKKQYSCHGLNVGLNLGSAAGAGIPEHLHYHVLPRWSGDTNFFPLIAETKIVVETLDSTYEKLAKDFKKLLGKYK
jgi:ATP adenylyltransferase